MLLMGLVYRGVSRGFLFVVFSVSIFFSFLSFFRQFVMVDGYGGRRLFFSLWSVLWREISRDIHITHAA